VRSLPGAAAGVAEPVALDGEQCRRTEPPYPTLSTSNSQLPIPNFVVWELGVGVLGVESLPSPAFMSGGWRKRLGVEPSLPAKRGASGFEDREGHRAPFASVTKR